MKNTKNEFNLKDIPNDQYVCPECELMPEIKKIDFNEGFIEIYCPKHKEIILKIDKYFQNELKNLYIKKHCQFTPMNQWEVWKRDNNDIFGYFERKVRCIDCMKGKDPSKIIKVNEINNKCFDHLMDFNAFCTKCEKHFCGFKECKCKHTKEIKEITQPKKEDINTLVEKKNSLIKYKEIIDYLIKILATSIETYEKHPKNYYNMINIQNIANSIKNQSREKIIRKFENVHQKILNYFNQKLKIEIKPDSIKIDLGNKNLDNIDLNLICEVPFDNLEELNLRNNNITDIKFIKNLKAKNLKKLDLSFNKLNNIEPIKNSLINKQFPMIKYINLENTDIIVKDLEEIRNILMDGKLNKQCKLNYILEKSKNKVRLFGKDFVDKNNKKCKMQIEGEDKIIEIKEELEYKEIKKEIIKKGSINITLFLDDDINDVKGLFYECDKLKAVNDIFYIDSYKIKDISDMFYGCSSLVTLSNTISFWDVSEIKNMSGLFFNCSSLKSLPDMSRWKTDSVTNMMSMFRGCSHLEKLPDLSKWNLSNVGNVKCLFYECSSLKEMPNLSKWNTSNITEMGFMFYKCSSLKEMPDLSKWNTSKVKNMESMFKNCSSLKSKPKINVNQNTNVNEMF